MIQKNAFFVALLALVCFCQSCNIATTVHFNKNYSGSYSTVLDLSDLLGFALMADTTGTMDQGDMIDKMRFSLDSMELEDKYNGITGIRETNVDVSDEGVVTIAFKFDNIDALNASFKEMQEQATQNADGMGESMLPTDFLGGGNQLFTRQGKMITHTMSTDAGLGEGLMGEEGGSDMDMFSSMIDYTIDLSFDRKVKSVDVKGLTVVEKGTNVVRTRVDFASFLKDGKYSIAVTTK
jgi:hypothetical protein